MVIPTYNERETISRLISRVIAEPRFRVIVVDDNSPDLTGDIVHQIALEESRVELLARERKLGLGSAYVAGLKRALSSHAEFIFEMDADFSHDPGYLNALLETAERGHDLVLGSRYVAGGGTSDWGLARQMISRCANFYARAILAVDVKDCTSGFRCFRRRVLERTDFDALHSNGYSFHVELLYRTLVGGFSVAEVPIRFPDRRVGASKMSYRDILEALVTVWRLRLMRTGKGDIP